MKKDILIFDLYGTAAHFRKFFTNSSSLSYSIPPRTVLCGLIAAILGFDRDSYYEEFAKERMDIGVRKNTRTRRIMQSLNYMKITSPGEFQTPKEHTQIPFEIIVGESGMVSYRIYLSFVDKGLMDTLEERMKQKRFHYPPYLGVAPFLGQVEFVARVVGQMSNADQPVRISSVIPYDAVKDRGIQFSEIDTGQVLLLKERMPCEFAAGRQIKTVKSYIYDENAQSIPVLLREEHVRLEYGDTVENILFL